MISSNGPRASRTWSGIASAEPLAVGDPWRVARVLGGISNAVARTLVDRVRRRVQRLNNHEVLWSSGTSATTAGADACRTHVRVVASPGATLAEVVQDQVATGGRVRLLDDNPTTEDALGFRHSADRILEAITDIATRPVAIGIFGGWGSGKTSLMLMVEERLETKGIKTVWFNAWKYDGKEAIWNAFIQTILLKMKEDGRSAANDDFRKRVVSVSKELAKFAARVATRAVPGGIVRPEDVDAFLEAISSSADDDLFQFMNRFERKFAELVTEWVGEDRYVVVFIDDLDRCLPESAVEVLEALKLYLDQTNCVFVIGVEPAIVQEAIRRRYHGHPSLSESEYLEKIIQIPFVLPRVRAKAALELAVSGRMRLTPDEEKQMGKLIKYGLDRNPRRVKRLFNALAIAASDDAAAGAEKERLGLAKILVLQMRFPEFYRDLRRDPGLIAKLEEGSHAWSASEAELRRFIDNTRRIRLDADTARRWIRVAARTEVDDDVDEAPAEVAG